MSTVLFWWLLLYPDAPCMEYLPTFGIWRKLMVNALVDILCIEHTGYLLYKPTSCCFPLQAFFFKPIFLPTALPGMCVPWRAPFGSPRWTSRVHPGQRLLRFVTWDERNFMTNQQGLLQLSSFCLGFRKIVLYNLGGEWNLGWRSNICHFFEGTLKGLQE